MSVLEDKYILVQKFLAEKSFGELAKEHGVYASFSKSGHKFSLNYDQIEAKESDPLAQQCRGLVLACHDGRSLSSEAVMVNGKLSYDNVIPGVTWLMAYPMNRFFNHGQGAAANVNWSDPGLAVLEKLDGTLCIVYWDIFTNQWCVATRSVSEADLLMDNGIFTFRTLFEKALKDTCGHSFEEYSDRLNKSVTYCFELTTPYNRIVVNYPDCRVTLLAARRLYDGYTELNLTKLDLGSVNPNTLYGVPIVKAYTYTSVQELVDWVSTLNPMEHEGVVVLDSNFNRIKVKNAAYVAYNKLHDRLGSSERNCMEFVLLEKDDDVKAFLPEEIVKNMETLKTGLQNALAKYDTVYSEIQFKMKELGEGATQKDYALMVNSHPELWSAPFFQIRAGKASSMRDFIQKSRKDGTWVDSFLDKILELSKKNV